MKIDLATETIDQCILCRTSDACPDSRFATLLGLVRPYDVVRCRTCGLRWLSPRPASAGYYDLYTADNYFDGEQAVESYAAISSIRAAYFQKRLADIERQINQARLSILDVGAATGEFVQAARSRGHQAVGLELSDSARQTAKEKYDLTLVNAELASLPGHALYDLIHMNHVFEHLPDPIAGLRSCWRLLKDNGLLVLEVPQQFDNDLDRLKRRIHLSSPPRFNPYSLHHTYFYTPDTLTRLLTQSGFTVRRLATSNPARTPLRPFSLMNVALRVYLWACDTLHRGGNIIEVYAAKTIKTSL